MYLIWLLYANTPLKFSQTEAIVSVEAATQKLLVVSYLTVRWLNSFYISSHAMKFSVNIRAKSIVDLTVRKLLVRAN